MRATRQISLGLMGLCLLLGAPISSAWAQGSRGKPEQQAEALDVEALKKDLASRQEARVLGALTQLKTAPVQGKELAPDVEHLLSKGTTLKITLNALRVLGSLGEQRSSKVIAPYVQHRTGSVRHAAASSLVQTGGPEAVATLRRALRAPDPQVRNVAARGLGALGAKETLGDLFDALDHRVYAAAVSIGKLCAPSECMKFMEGLQRLHLEVITSGTDEILFRPESEVDEKTKLAIIENLGGLRTQPATQYLIDVYKRWPQERSKTLKTALRDTVEDNGGDVGDDE